MNEEQNMQMANLLLDAIDTGMLNENTIGMFNLLVFKCAV